MASKFILRTAFAASSKRFACAPRAAMSTYFTKTHEYITVKDNIGTVGITDTAADALGDVVFVELPAVGRKMTASESFGSVESVKAASDVYSPVAGEIVETNTQLEGSPVLVNQSPFKDGWFMKIKLSADGQAQLKGLLNEEKYRAFVKESHH